MLDLHKYWNDRASTYYVPDVFGRKVLKAFIERLRPPIDPKNGMPESFIEVGCGRGELFPLYKHFTRVVAVDFSENMIAESEKRIKRHNYQIELFILDVTKGHLKERFDILMTRTCLMHIHPDNIEAACSNVAAMSDELLIFEYWEQYLRRELAPHNWLHDYHGLFTAQGYKLVEDYQRPDVRQVLFHFKR